MRTLKLIAFIWLPLGLVSCANNETLQDKKSKLEELKASVLALNNEIAELKKEIKSEDPDYDKNQNSELVSILSPTYERFVHQTEIRGNVESRKNVLISSQIAGYVESIRVKEGQPIKKGQQLIKINADILENNILEVKTQLELAKTIFNRQENLWKQNIGTEIQYLQAKNNKVALERQLTTLNSQLSQAYIKAPFTGTVDDISIKIGETAQPGLPLIRIVNQKEMYVKASASEVLLGKFNRNDVAEIYFPSYDISVMSKIFSVGNVIDPQNRTFVIEASIPKNNALTVRPNQVAILTLTDYQKEKAISVPTKLIQFNDQGNFIYVAKETTNGILIASKLPIKVGLSYKSKTEILEGLTTDDKMIAEGFRNVSEGTEITLK